PGLEIELAVEVDVAAAQAHTLAVDAWKIRLSTDPAAEAAVERVIPDVQLPDRRRIHRRDEVAGVVGDVHEVIVGHDAAHGRNDVVGQFAGWPGIEAPAAVCEANHSALGLGPAKDRQVPRRPIFDYLGDSLIGPDVILLAQPQQAYVTAVARRKT